MLYPSLGAEASDAEKTHSFNIARAAFNTEQRITIEDGLIVAASRLNCSTQMSSALAEVVSELDEAMFDPANMVVAHYLTRHHASKRYPGGHGKNEFYSSQLKFLKKHMVLPSSVTTEFVGITTFGKTK